MMKQFKVVVPSFNSPEFLKKCLASIEMQTYKNYQVCIVDDASTLEEQRKVILDYCNRNKWRYIFHDKNTGALQGLIEAIRDFQCDDNDVIVVIDGDDWLAHHDVFKKLHDVYSSNDIYLTWGQCEKYPPGHSPMKYAQPVPDMVIDQKLYRDIPFVFWHLGTFKYILWKYIKDEDLRDENGEYFKLLKDKATLFPMLEMAGHKIKFIPETLYIYNLDNPLNDFRTTTTEEWERVNQYLKRKPRYQTLNLL